MRELRRMERFTADALKAERDSHIKAALKANTPWPDIVADYGITLEEVMRLAGHEAAGQKRGSSMIWKPGDPQPEGRFDDGR